MFHKTYDENVSSKNSEEQKQTKSIFICSVCNKKFDQVKDMRVHISKHDPDAPVLKNILLHDSNILSLESLLMNSPNYTKSFKKELRRFSCKFCGAKFRFQKTVTSHRCQHTENQMLTCRVCGQQFSDEISLSKHYNIHCKIFPCKICNKRFTTNRSLAVHIRFHTGEKPYSCEKCFKRFTQNSHLRTHYLTHTGHKPHQCDLCAMSFGIKSSLKRHKLIHAEQRPYICEKCGRSFIRKCALDRHVLCHEVENETDCKICGLRFGTHAGLQSHNSYAHYDQSTLTCNVCGEGYEDTTVLRQHYVIHSNHQAHFCDICDNHYKKAWMLKRHRLRHFEDSNLSSKRQFEFRQKLKKLGLLEIIKRKKMSKKISVLSNKAVCQDSFNDKKKCSLLTAEVKVKTEVKKSLKNN